MNLDVAYKKWENQGCPLDQNGSVPHEVKMYYVYRTLRDYDLRSFVESGTSYGDGVAAMLPYVDVVHTIEAWTQAYDHSTARFSGDTRVTIHFGDSGLLLPEILDEVGPSVFWLDAHYSGDGTACLEKETPIVAELSAISRSSNRDDHCIVIDDARGFGVWKDYPPIVWMEEHCGVIFPHHKFLLEGDEIFVLP